MPNHLSIVLLALLASITVTPLAKGQPSGVVSMAIGQPGSESFVFGTELWAMGQIALKPEHGIDLSIVEVADDRERLNLLRDAEIEIALVSETVPTSHASHMRSLMVLWPRSDVPKKAEPAQLLAHKDMADDVIYRITKAIFENPNFFRNTQETEFGLADRHQATVGVALPIHPGASRYYHEVNVGFSSSGGSAGFAPKSKEAVEHRQSQQFVNFDDEALNDEERSQIIAACRQALELGALSLVLGDLSSRGCEVYQSELDDRHDHRRLDVEAMDAILYPTAGQGGPAVALDEIVGERHAAGQSQPKRELARHRQPTM